ncbi:hypothetical protein [Nocardia noduli]|uniref:hypothetical protein n=1 Tax=Nocardia noduli TaxID=2815722 RepID=UPI001C235C2A|nr:hypothetical protein [Nocardia noduli]
MDVFNVTPSVMSIDFLWRKSRSGYVRDRDIEIATAVDDPLVLLPGDAFRVLRAVEEAGEVEVVVLVLALVVGDVGVLVGVVFGGAYST